MKKVLITGASGLLGKYLMANVPSGIETASARYSNMSAFCALQLDVASMLSVMRAMYVFKPDIVIHAAAIGAVDFCEKHEAVAKTINVYGTQNVAMACKDFGAKLVLLSTNAVFDGTLPPYDEDCITSPISVYGHTKVEAENSVRKMVDNHLIIRTARLFGLNWPGGRENWVNILATAVNTNRQMKITVDDIANPTYAKFLARSIWDLIGMDATGTYHVAGEHSMTMFDFAYILLKGLFMVDPDKFITPVSNKGMPEGVMARPADTAFNMQKLLLSGAYVPESVDAAIPQLRQEMRELCYD